MPSTTALTYRIKQQALALGFASCGMARAERLDDEARYLESWLNQNQHGKMSYLENHFDKRVDPTLLLPGAKTVISLSFNYYSDRQQTDPTAPKLAMYAYGQDYHSIVRQRLDALVTYIRTQTGDVAAQCCVDTAPVLERAWAQRAGVGWMGKNTNLLTKRQGSYFFLAEIILDLELDYDSPVKDYCGSCTRCIDACPTQAITAPYQLDASKCISYLTIELRDAVIPAPLKEKMSGWMYGCDICQQVCPINSQSRPHQVPELAPTPALLDMTWADWAALSIDQYRILFKGSAVKRAKYTGLIRNIQAVTSSSVSE
jgi:epoxyqueuosine reductase